MLNQAEYLKKSCRLFEAIKKRSNYSSFFYSIGYSIFKRLPNCAAHKCARTQINVCKLDSQRFRTKSRLHLKTRAVQLFMYVYVFCWDEPTRAPRRSESYYIWLTINLRSFFIIYALLYRGAQYFHHKQIEHFACWITLSAF
jgi:hypothetical protein